MVTFSCRYRVACLQHPHEEERETRLTYLVGAGLTRREAEDMENTLWQDTRRLLEAIEQEKPRG